MPEPRTPLRERPWENVERMLGVDEALGIVLASFTPLPSVELPILDAVGLVLAEDVVATEPVPPFRNSAMDGFAIRAADAAGASEARPVSLPVVAEVAAGSPIGTVLPRQMAARIMTGAPLPEGADAVVRFEETDGGSERAATVRVYRAPAAGDNVREAGEDVRLGAVVLRRGRRLRPADAGLLAALNRPTVSVHRRPRIAILSTGDEVVDVGAPLRPGQVRNSNSYTLAAMARTWGADATLLGIASDTSADLSAKLAGAPGSDLLVTSGGVSVGDFDLVKDVLRERGEVSIWQVRMKPGKPLAFGRVGAVPLLGLPGNPVAAAVSFAVFGQPAIATMLGQPAGERTVEVELGERLDNRGMRRHFVRVTLERSENGRLVARTAGDQGAGVLSSLCRADALLIVPEACDVAEPGRRLRAMPIDPDFWPDAGGETFAAASGGVCE